jgi:hypothetical protein
MNDPNPNLKVNARTKDLAYTALAWKSPQLLKIFIVTTASGFIGLFLLILSIPLLAEAPVFNSKSRKAMKFYDYCFGKVQLENPQISGADASNYCNKQVYVYKLDL